MAIFIKKGEVADDFIDSQFLKDGQDQNTLRNRSIHDLSRFRQLEAHEEDELKEYNNKAENWNFIFVTDKFDPKKVYKNQPNPTKL